MRVPVKVGVLIMTVVILFTTTARAGEIFDGYVWEELSGDNGFSKLLKIATVKTYIAAFKAGYMVGTDGTKEITTKESPDFYVKEFDSFLKTYPLCKKENINNLLALMIAVWSGITTYEKISKKCSEIN